ncbi:hypothetical protein [Streptomyces sp. NPDC047071]|uniref:hypothetical protein n=1 Tax=Streptomyces sp. NPDC047071 TaxID=3154808 RepID=UPI0034522AAE
MNDRTREPRLPEAESTALWKAPQWGAEAPSRVVFPGYGKPIATELREAELERFIGCMTTRGWTQAHRMPGAVLVTRVQHAEGGTAVGVGATGVAAGAAVGPVSWVS